MHILQLCPRVPFPLTDGGRIGMFHLTRTLAEHGHQIDMIAFAEDDTIPEHITALEKYCRVQLVHDNIKTNIKNFLRSILRNEPVYITRHQSKKFYAALHDALAKNKYDAVYGDHSAMFPFLLEAQRTTGAAVAVRLHNVESVIWRRYARDERNPVKRIIAQRQATMLENYEARCAALVDINFTITDVDRDRLEHLAPTARVVTVLPGVDATHWSPQTRAPHSTKAITATTFNWIHNVNGMLWFLDHAMPRILKSIPNFELDLLGQHPPQVLQRRASAAVKVLGFVEDIRPCVAQAGVYIVPLHVGSGIRIKILEAMAMGMPVVTTSVGCEGIPGIHGTHFLIADTEEEFADAVITMLTNREHADAIGRAARTFVVEHFNWDTAATIIERELAAIISHRAEKFSTAHEEK